MMFVLSSIPINFRGKDLFKVKLREEPPLTGEFTIYTKHSPELGSEYPVHITRVHTIYKGRQWWNNSLELDKVKENSLTCTLAE